jgi:putative restriction endonuclease
MDRNLEEALRAAAFAWLDDQVAKQGEVLEGGLLRHGFDFRGKRVPLAVQRGIFRPQFIEAALSLRTALVSPYRDHFHGDDTLVYSYRGTDPHSWDNVAARRAYEWRLPVVYLFAVSERPPRYAVVKPVWIVADDPASLEFRLKADLPGGVALSTELRGASLSTSESIELELKRSYGTRLVRTRLHQVTFRERVLQAYRRECAMCRLKHPKLLDAAHIDRDADPLGEPLVTNGISLCRIHHGAFDVKYVSVEPSTYRIRVQRTLLEEEDGPMLRHGLQELEGLKLRLPRRVADRPDPERLGRHWTGFQAAS